MLVLDFIVMCKINAKRLRVIVRIRGFRMKMKSAHVVGVEDREEVRPMQKLFILLD